MAVQRAQLLHVRLAQAQLVRPVRQRHVGADGHQLPVQRQPLQRRAQVLADLALDRRRGGDHPVQRAVLGQPLGRGLGSALVHADDVVHGIAHQRQHVHDQVRRHAELLGHRRIRVHAAAGHGVDQGDAAAAVGGHPHQLGEVLVAGGDGHVDPGLGRPDGQGADHVVGLHPLHAQDVDAQRMHDPAHRLDLRAQLLRHRRAVGLVLGIQLVAEGPAGRVHHEGHVVRLLLEGGPQHVDHAEQRAGGFAGGVGQRGQRVERAVQVAGTVDEDEAFHRGILAAAPAAGAGAGALGHNAGA
jgi:hypothetical protein